MDAKLNSKTHCKSRFLVSSSRFLRVWLSHNYLIWVPENAEFDAGLESVEKVERLLKKVIGLRTLAHLTKR
jgi:hypothetical protein